jgi:uncharacterized protein (TIGR00730 family)
MAEPRDGPPPLPSAGEDLARAQLKRETLQTQSPSYRLAFADQDFLLRDELRPVRLQLELLKPELLLSEHRIDSTVVVFGSARIPAPEAAAAAREFARLVSRAGQMHGPERRFVVVTGGGPGVMEAANRGAHDVGAESVGLNIVLPHEQAPNSYITPQLCFRFHYFGIRKLHFMLRARAMVCFPGGFGTLDELFDVLTLIQTGKAKPMPVLLFDEKYWRRIVNFDAMVEEGVISPGDRDLVRYVESAEAAWRVICAHYDIDPALADGGS